MTPTKAKKEGVVVFLVRVLSIAIVALLSATTLGCIEPLAEGDPVIEAFIATYRVSATHSVPEHNVTVTLEGPRLFLAADGTFHPGYAVDVQHGPGEFKLGRPQTILNADFQPVRNRWCNGWSGETGECMFHQYDWHKGMSRYPLIPVIGIATNLAAPHNSTTVQEDGVLRVGTSSSVYEFGDWKLAPTRILAGPDSKPDVHAVRTSYLRTGALDPISPPEPVPQPRDGVRGPLFPGADVDVFNQGFTLNEALDFLRDDEAVADAILDHAGCVAAIWSFVGREYPNPLPFPINDQPTETVGFTVANLAKAESFDVAWGRRAITGENAFLETEENDQRQSFRSLDCQGRNATAMSLSESFGLAQRVAPGDEIRRYDITWSGPGPPRLFHQFDIGGVLVSVDATSGQLWYVHHFPLDVELDP